MKVISDNKRWGLSVSCQRDDGVVLVEVMQFDDVGSFHSHHLIEDVLCIDGGGSVVQRSPDGVESRNYINSGDGLTIKPGAMHRMEPSIGGGGMVCVITYREPRCRQ